MHQAVIRLPPSRAAEEAEPEQQIGFLRGRGRSKQGTFFAICQGKSTKLCSNRLKFFQNDKTDLIFRAAGGMIQSMKGGG